jgi:hypothetical protein
MIDGYTYLLMKFGKLILWIIIHGHGLQNLKISCDLELLVYFVVEIPWNTPSENHTLG